MGKIIGLLFVLLAGSSNAKGSGTIVPKSIIEQISLSGILNSIEQYPWQRPEETAKRLREWAVDFSSRTATGEAVRYERVVAALGAPDASLVLPRKSSEPDKGFVLIYYSKIISRAPNNNNKTCEFYFGPSGVLRTVRIDGKKINLERHEK